MGFYPFTPLSGAPSGAAGGSLTGTYPNPGLSASGTVTALAGGNTPTGSPSGVPVRVATTGTSGAALTAGTPTLLSWTAPNDGNAHVALAFIDEVISSGLTGGAIGFTYTAPTGASASPALSPGGGAAGTFLMTNVINVVVAAGSTLSINQTSGLTGGAAVVHAQIWAL